jgi:hypothetical protein
MGQGMHRRVSGTASRGRSAVARFVHREPHAAWLEDEVGTSRRSFLRNTGGYAAGVAGVIAVPAAVLLEVDADAAVPAPKTVANPTTPVPDGPVMAYVHDAKKGTVVIMSGTTERTVQDHDLVQRLLHAPVKKKKAKAKAKRKHKRTPATTTTKKRS